MDALAIVTNHMAPFLAKARQVTKTQTPNQWSFSLPDHAGDVRLLPSETLP
jgi:hypothetical protein